MLCRFVSRPSNSHWKAIDRVVRLLNRTMNLGLHYQRFMLSWEDTQMQIGTSYKMIPEWPVNIYLISMKELFLRKAKKQNILAQSTSKSEKIALATASEEASWLTCLLAEIPLWENNWQLCWSIAIVPQLLQKIENRYYNGKRWQIRHRTELLERYSTHGL